MKKKILVVAAHPDDEILGCGATMAKLSEEGHEIHILIFGEGPFARDANISAEQKRAEQKKLWTEINHAAKIVGARGAEALDFPDNQFDTVPLLDLIKKVEAKKREFNPQVIFTHHAHDLNIDHQRVFQAVLTACRPLAHETVKEIYSFEVPSATEWQAPASEKAFLPTKFVRVDEKHVMAKIEALRAYSEEIREFPHPRSVQALRTLAQWRGCNVGSNFAEAFEVIRQID